MLRDPGANDQALARVPMSAASGLGRPRRGFRSLRVAAIVASLCSSGQGCARREPVDLEVLARVHDSDPELDALRVYVDRRLIVVYPELDASGEIELADGVVEERFVSRELRQIVGRNRAGAVIAAAEDERTLWISFDPTCSAVDCAFAFVVAEDDSFVLGAVPERAGRDSAVPYRGRRASRARLVPRLADPESSATEVLVRPRRRRASAKVGLELRRRSYRGERADTERVRGFDR